MIRRILILLIAFMIIALIALFFLSGGARRIQRAAALFTNPIDLIFNNGTSTGFLLSLPWQPAQTTRGPDLSAYTSGYDEETEEERLERLQAEYEELSARAQEAKDFGSPSPDAGKVFLSGEEHAQESDVSLEYIEITADPKNTSPVSLAGWSVQSALSAARIAIPPATGNFKLGALNGTASVYLDVDGRAILHSALSPVGISFRENICTGYLQQFQSFIPELSRSCPAPRDSLPITAQNVQKYGDECIDFVASLRSCTFPQNLPDTLSSACKSFVTNTFSYNGCAAIYASRPTFNRNSWRLYLGSPVELWRNTHDVIRLLDANGAVVDVMTY